MVSQSGSKSKTETETIKSVSSKTMLILGHKYVLEELHRLLEAT